MSFHVAAIDDQVMSLRIPRGQHVAHVDVIGVTGRRNPYAEEWSPRHGQALYLATLGRLPSARLNWAF